MKSRSPTFDYVKYDQASFDRQAHCLRAVEDMEHAIIASTGPGRAHSLALTKLEECFMWIGKAIRDDQLKREATAETLQAP